MQNAQDFQVLVEGTEDHVLLASTLRRWMPSAQDLARAQEMELRNRQQFDYVLNPADLQSVNGNINVAPDTATGVDQICATTEAIQSDLQSRSWLE